MKRTLMLLASACMLAMSAASNAWRETTHFVIVTAERACSWIGKLFMAGVKLFAEKSPMHRPAIALVTAKAFVLRLMKRERPQVTPGWRMCPSV